jgi:hypothetical protein
MSYGHFSRFFRTISIEIEIIMKNSEEEESSSSASKCFRKFPD